MHRVWRILWIAATIVFALFVAWIVFARAHWGAQADVRAAFLAKQVCSCHFVGGRDAEWCRRDMGTDFDPLRWELRGNTVHAGIPLLASRSATWHEGMGCTLE
jgi:hypothetical protein